VVGSDRHQGSPDQRFTVNNVVKNVMAFFATIIVGLAVGSALLTIETVENLELDVKKRVERHRTHRA
jgi:hypothetical protein